MTTIEYIPKHWQFLQNNADKDVLTLYGGSASGKTHAVLLWFAMRLLTEEHFEGILCRKYRPTLKLTLLKDLISILKGIGVWESCEFNKSELTIEYRDSKLYFIPLIEPERIKGIDVDLIYVDEVTEVEEDIFSQLLLRFGRSKSHKHAQLIASSNPVSAEHWCYRELVQANYPERACQHSTHLDNPFLSEQFRQRLLGLKDVDENFYRVYCLGEPGKATGLVYPANWEVTDEKLEDFDCFGIDWGYTHPLVIVGCKQTGERELTFRQLYYESGKLVDADIIPWMRRLKNTHHFDKHPIYPDTANPAYNQMLANAGYRVGKTNKDVIEGINFLKGYKLRFTSDSPDLIKEIRTYSWRVDKEGNEMDEPVKEFDDGMDACRYAAVSHFMIRKRRMSKPVFLSGGGHV